MKKLTSKMLAALFMFGAFASMSAMAPTTANAENCAAIIYEHVNYGGESQCLQTGTYDVDELTIGNDTLSSIKIFGSHTVVLYQHSGFSGKSSELASSAASMSSWNDVVSSIVVK